MTEIDTQRLLSLSDEAYAAVAADRNAAHRDAITNTAGLPLQAHLAVVDVAHARVAELIPFTEARLQRLRDDNDRLQRLTEDST